MSAPLLTTRQVAERLSLSVQRVNQLAKARGLGQSSPWGYRLFTEDDLAAFANRNPGRPRKDA